MDPDGEQIVRAHAAGDRAGPAVREEIGYINYHGTSTRPERRRRGAVRAPLFGALADRVPGSSTKSMIGHPAGRQRRGRHRRHGARAPPRIPAADDQPDRSRSGSATSTSSRTRAARPRRRGRALQLPGIRIEEQRHRARTGRATDMRQCRRRRSRGRTRRARLRRWCSRAPGARVLVLDRARVSPRQAVRRHGEPGRARDAARPRTWRM